MNPNLSTQDLGGGAAAVGRVGVAQGEGLELVGVVHNVAEEERRHVVELPLGAGGGPDKVGEGSGNTPPPRHPQRFLCVFFQIFFEKVCLKPKKALSALPSTYLD